MERDELNELRARFDDAVRRDPEARETLEMAVAALEITGQCRIETPFADLRPVLTKNGMRWCCTHPTEHCSNEIDALGEEDVVPAG